jgi:hypothetical protein
MQFMGQKLTMYLGSMDHSPSEQLGKPDDWHTTVLILSEGGQHDDAAKDVAHRLGYRDGSLRKWSRNPTYRQKDRFGSALLAALPSHAVFVRAISAQARVISQFYPRMIKELGFGGLVQSLSKNGKPYLKFGPFMRASYGSEPQRAYLDILERQALPLIFICYNVLRVHRQLMRVITTRRPEIEWVDWQLMPNKFPGDVTGRMGTLFHAIMSGAALHRLVEGNISVMTFSNSKDDVGSLFADNIAGWLSEKMAPGGKGFGLPAIGDLFDWDVWTENKLR